MKHKITSLILTLAVLLSCCPAALATDIQPIASDQINLYTATLKQGGEPGQIRISYTVSGIGTMNSIGVSKIVIYQSNGTYVTTIYGTTVNGLVAVSSISHSGTYTYTGTPGVAYYAEVTVMAVDSTGSTTRTVTTGTVTAPLS